MVNNFPKHYHKIELADHWSEEISKAYAEVSDGDVGATDSGLEEDEQVALDAVAEWEAENRPIDFKHKGVNHKSVPLKRAWTELQSLASQGYLKITYDSSNNPNEYRLTDDGWEQSSLTEPDADELSSEAKQD